MRATQKKVSTRSRNGLANRRHAYVDRPNALDQSDLKWVLDDIRWYRFLKAWWLGLLGIRFLHGFLLATKLLQTWSCLAALFDLQVAS
jgi:hypothetical protein